MHDVKMENMKMLHYFSSIVIIVIINIVLYYSSSPPPKKKIHMKHEINITSQNYLA